MHLRADALVAAARFVVAINQMASLRAAEAPRLGHFAATVGEFRIEPNAANVVPAYARLLIDARAERRGEMEAFLRDLEGGSAGKNPRGDEGDAAHRLRNPPTPSDLPLVAEIEAAAEVSAFPGGA